MKKIWQSIYAIHIYYFIQIDIIESVSVPMKAVFQLTGNRDFFH